jgi:hypothetical protein
MTQQELSKAKNPDLRASLVAMKRAAAVARQVAVATNTAIVVVRDGKPVRISAQQLREGQG